MLKNLLFNGSINMEGLIMKKIVAVILILIMLIVSSIVFADGMPPTIVPLRYMVINSDGAEVYEYSYGGVATRKDNIPYGTIIESYDSEASDYPKIGFDNIRLVNKKDDYYSMVGNYAKYDDLRLINDVEVIPEKLFEKPITGVVINPAGVTGYMGPNNTYKKVNISLPQNSKVEILYDIQERYDWYFANVNGVQVWLTGKEFDELSKVGSIGYLEKEVMLLNDVKDKSGNIILHYGTKLNEHIRCYTNYGSETFVSYEGKIYPVEVARRQYNLSATVSDENAKLYKKPYIQFINEAGQVVSTDRIFWKNLESGEVLSVEYQQDSYGRATGLEPYAVLYDGELGWIYPEESNYEFFENKSSEVETNKIENSELDVDNADTSNMDAKELIIWCIAGAVALVIIAIVTITLINKNKKK